MTDDAAVEVPRNTVLWSRNDWRVRYTGHDQVVFEQLRQGAWTWVPDRHVHQEAAQWMRDSKARVEALESVLADARDELGRLLDLVGDADYELVEARIADIERVLKGKSDGRR